MKFTLYYQGPLRPNAGPQEKHQIREVIHPQLVDLWSHPPLDALVPYALSPEYPEQNVLFQVGPHKFGCVISERLGCTAALDITLLRPETPGALLAQGGDIDNRLKTLLDALSVPSNPQAIPRKFAPDPTQIPLFCLLQDDALVTGLQIRTERWLNPSAANNAEVVLLIRVSTFTSKNEWYNVGFS